jgi:hypothetical protein
VPQMETAQKKEPPSLQFDGELERYGGSGSIRQDHKIEKDETTASTTRCFLEC